MQEWFARNYQRFGYAYVVRASSGCDFYGGPPSGMGRGDRPDRIEIETKASNFIVHGHDPEYVDLVVCAKFNLEDVTEKAVRHNLVEAIVPVFA